MQHLHVWKGIGQNLKCEYLTHFLMELPDFCSALFQTTAKEKEKKDGKLEIRKETETETERINYSA